MAQKLTNRKRRLRHRAMPRPGVVATECALTLPILLLLGLATADFGRVAHFHETVTNAARTAAETGAGRSFTDFTKASWENDVRQAALDELSSLSAFDENQATVTIATSMDDDDLARIVVTVSYPFSTTVAWPGLSSQLQLEHRVEFRQFR